MTNKNAETAHDIKVVDAKISFLSGEFIKIERATYANPAKITPALQYLFLIVKAIDKIPRVIQATKKLSKLEG